MSKINIGIAGNPKNIEQYLPYVLNSSTFSLIGTFDSSNERNFENFYGLNTFTDFIKRTDAIIFCGEIHHNLFELISEGIKHSKHILLQKFPSFNGNQLLILQKLIKEADIKLFISDVFGTASEYTAARQYIIKPTHLSANILLPYRKQLTINAKQQHLSEILDMTLRSMNSRVSKVKVNRQYIFNEQPDVLKINILFENSCTADIIYNTFSQSSSQLFTLYQKGKIINVHLDSHKVEETRLDVQIENQLSFTPSENTILALNPKVEVFEKKILYFDAIQKDLLNFVDCITHRISPLVGIEELIDVANVLQQLQYSEYEEFV